MARKKKEEENKSEITEENDFVENVDTDKVIEIDEEETFDDSGFYFELEEEVSFTTKRAYDEDDEEDMSLDIAFTDDDPRDMY